MRPVRQLVSPFFSPPSRPFQTPTLCSIHSSQSWHATLCWCCVVLLVPQSFWRIIFTAPGNWNEMSAWFCSLHWHCSGLLCVWSALLWSVLFPFPQCKPIYALSRLADSLVRIHSSLILVSFACATALPLLVVWTVNGLAWVCFAPMTTLSTEQSQLTRHTAHCSSVLNSQ